MLRVMRLCGPPAYVFEQKPAQSGGGDGGSSGSSGALGGGQIGEPSAHDSGHE